MSVAVTFGSVGDIIAVVGIIKDLITTLNDSRGSSADYQRILRELTSLQNILHHLDDLTKACEIHPDYTALRDAARLEALECARLVEPFKEKLQRYSRSLRIGGSGNAVKDAYEKVHYRVLGKDDVEQFRNDVRTRVEAMTALLMTASLLVHGDNVTHIRFNLFILGSRSFLPIRRYRISYSHQGWKADSLLSSRWQYCRTCRIE
jgi:hypothetical protein